MCWGSCAFLKPSLLLYIFQNESVLPILKYIDSSLYVSLFVFILISLLQNTRLSTFILPFPVRLDSTLNSFKMKVYYHISTRKRKIKVRLTY